jgi:hypothetical protein
MLLLQYSSYHIEEDMLQVWKPYVLCHVTADITGRWRRQAMLRLQYSVYHLEEDTLQVWKLYVLCHVTADMYQWEQLSWTAWVWFYQQHTVLYEKVNGTRQQGEPRLHALSQLHMDLNYTYCISFNSA